uniref:FLYWCH-type domain-containing protein n=1 Tax=Timema poppense TaxID=170557 RepID=A0A7R9H2K6_TIMPO|nr:unnamed protein product [Timema poppensis]
MYPAKADTRIIHPTLVLRGGGKQGGDKEYKEGRRLALSKLSGQSSFDDKRGADQRLVSVEIVQATGEDVLVCVSAPSDGEKPGQCWHFFWPERDRLKGDGKFSLKEFVLLIYNEFMKEARDSSGLYEVNPLKLTREERWRCTKKDCKAKISTLDGGNIFSRTENEHSHEPLLDQELNRRSISNAVKRKAEEIEVRPSKWRKIQKLGLTATYKDENSDGGKWLHYCFGLTYLRPEEVEDAFCDLISIQPADTKLTSFADYLTETYIDEMEQATFPPRIRAADSSDLWRTTNAVGAIRVLSWEGGYWRNSGPVWGGTFKLLAQFGSELKELAQFGLLALTRVSTFKRSFSQ